jgi:hypothetical protein
VSQAVAAQAVALFGQDAAQQRPASPPRHTPETQASSAALVDVAPHATPTGSLGKQIFPAQYPASQSLLCTQAGVHCVPVQCAEGHCAGVTSLQRPVPSQVEGGV